MATVWSIFKLLPELFSLGKTIWGLLKSGVDIMSIKKSMRNMDENLKIAAKTKNTSELEAIFNPKPKSK